MNMINIKFNGIWPWSKYILTKGNQGFDNVLTPQKIPLLLLRIVDSGVKDEQLNCIQMY